MAYKILIADDDTELLKSVKEELEGKGFHVVTATNGQMAIRLAQSQRIDLVILDIAMPMTTGIQVFDRLRADPETQKTPVIFLTGLPSSEVYPTVAHGTRAAYSKKPLDMLELISLIQKMLQDFPRSQL